MRTPNLIFTVALCYFAQVPSSIAGSCCSCSNSTSKQQEAFEHRLAQEEQERQDREQHNWLAEEARARLEERRRRREEMKRVDEASNAATYSRDRVEELQRCTNRIGTPRSGW